MLKKHAYKLKVQWTGNRGTGTKDYHSYDRSHTITAGHKNEILASSDPSFRGDKERYNPEELLVAALSSCHMLWFLHLCTDSGVVVIDYLDHPTGILKATNNGSGQFSEVTLNPIVTVQDSVSLDKLEDLHNKANAYCFIANSVNFKVKHNPVGRTSQLN